MWPTRFEACRGPPWSQGLSAQPTHRSAPRRKAPGAGGRDAAQYHSPFYTVLCSSAKRVSPVRRRVHTGKHCEVPLASRARTFPRGCMMRSWLLLASHKPPVSSSQPGRRDKVVMTHSSQPSPKSARSDATEPYTSLLVLEHLPSVVTACCGFVPLPHY